jgi:hypothetical protein
VTWDRKKPWTAPAHALVLYLTENGWRYAVFGEGGILDGRMSDIPGESVEQAQDELLRRVEELTSRRYSASWTSEKPGWWETGLEPAP